MKAFNKPLNKTFPNKKGGKSTPTGPNADPSSERGSRPTIQSKLVLLTLSFPRLRIIWSSSPHATSETFLDLKKNLPEPDPAKAISIGAEEDPEAGKGVNGAAEELLRSLPGVSGKNVKWIMGRVGNVREFCQLSLEDLQELLGAGPGKECWEFLHRGDRSGRK
jgi:DNA excision repair protein ERCC-4